MDGEESGKLGTAGLSLQGGQDRGGAAWTRGGVASGVGQKEKEKEKTGGQVADGPI